MLTPVIDGICRAEGARVLAGLIRRCGDFELAEDALQDAFTKALECWPSQGLPAVPAAWLTTVAQRRVIDLLRRRHTGPLYVDEVPDLAAADALIGETDPADSCGVEDDRLRLLFTCCHPAITQPAQVALALRTLCGLSTREIARAFLEPESTTAQRLVRAKKKILEARIPYQIPDRDNLPERLDAVLGVIYLVFNEGYAATDTPGLLRPDLCTEAIRLARLLAELMPEAEVLGLLALMLLQDSRRDARVAPDGSMVPLEEQDRTLWRQCAIDEGRAILHGALLMRRRGAYQVQAAIAALHAEATRAEDTDWKQIAALYAAMNCEHPGAVVELNAAVALAMAEGAEHGLVKIGQLATREELDNYHLLPAARADLLRRLDRLGEARENYRAALALVRNPAERKYLERRLRECGG